MTIKSWPPRLGCSPGVGVGVGIATVVGVGVAVGPGLGVAVGGRGVRVEGIGVGVGGTGVGVGGAGAAVGLGGLGVGVGVASAPQAAKTKSKAANPASIRVTVALCQSILGRAIAPSFSLTPQPLRWPPNACLTSNVRIIDRLGMLFGRSSIVIAPGDPRIAGPPAAAARLAASSSLLFAVSPMPNGKSEHLADDLALHLERSSSQRCRWDTKAAGIGPRRTWRYPSSTFSRRPWASLLSPV